MTKKISEFTWLIKKVSCLSCHDYQKRVWVKHENSSIVDSYGDTMMYFLEDGEAIIQAYKAGRVEMSDKQYQMLKTLYQMVDEYDDLMDRPDSDEGIVNDPRWGKVREYAKLVYKELKKS